MDYLLNFAVVLDLQLNMEYICDDITKLPETAKWFLNTAGSDRIFAFHGQMGAGKTTLISEIARQLGVAEDTGSPTFSIVNEYDTIGAGSVFHFDFYRIGNIEEALDLGLDEYFESGQWCLMEWPERVEGLLPEETVDVTIEELPDGRRRISVIKPARG